MFSRLRNSVVRRFGAPAIAALVACGCLAATAQAQTTLLNTGTTSSGASAPDAMLSGSAFAEEFAIGASTTVDIGQLALWAISSTSSTPSGTLTFSLYSGALTGQRSPTPVDSLSMVLPTLSSTTARWVTATPSSSWIVTNSGTSTADYWLAVSFSGTTGLDLPLVTNSGTSTTPALALDYHASGTTTFSSQTTTSGWVGMEVLTTAVPEPESISLLIAGLGALAFALPTRRVR